MRMIKLIAVGTYNVHTAMRNRHYTCSDNRFYSLAGDRAVRWGFFFMKIQSAANLQLNNNSEMKFVLIAQVGMIRSILLILFFTAIFSTKYVYALLHYHAPHFIYQYIVIIYLIFVPCKSGQCLQIIRSCPLVYRYIMTSRLQIYGYVTRNIY